MVNLEICVDSIQSAFAASEGGASRLELCSALSEGGLTPSVGILKFLKSHLNIPIYCMLRPRPGNDFLYSEDEMQTILYDLEILRSYGSDGFVFGALQNDKSINANQCKSIIKNSSGLPITFHRAFDLTKQEDMLTNCKLLESLGFQRILTSGFEKTAEQGLDNLKQLISDDNIKIGIMPGAGITPENIEKIISKTYCKEFHASAKRKITYEFDKTTITMGPGNDESYFVTDVNIVKQLVCTAKKFS